MSVRLRKGEVPAWTIRRPVDTVTLDVTRPPGVNNLFLNIPGKGRIIAKPYRDWRKLAEDEIFLQRAGGVRGPFHISLSAERTSRRSDLDGILKATLDALKRAGVIQDDNLAQSIDAQWHGRGTQMRVRVTSTKEIWHERVGQQQVGVSVGGPDAAILERDGD